MKRVTTLFALLAVVATAGATPPTVPTKVEVKRGDKFKFVVTAETGKDDKGNKTIKEIVYDAGFDQNKAQVSIERLYSRQPETYALRIEVGLNARPGEYHFLFAVAAAGEDMMSRLVVVVPKDGNDDGEDDIDPAPAPADPLVAALKKVYDPDTEAGLKRDLAGLYTALADKAVDTPPATWAEWRSFVIEAFKMKALDGKLLKVRDLLATEMATAFAGTTRVNTDPFSSADRKIVITQYRRYAAALNRLP